jgi:hypothetical protein
VTATEYFEAVQAAYHTAEARVGGGVARVYRVARHGVRLRFAGRALIGSITPALEHLATGDDCESSDSLTVCLFDSASTDTALPPMPWSTRYQDRRGDVVDFCDERFVFGHYQWSGIVTLFDRRRRRALFWINDGADLPYHERGAPLLMSLQGWLGLHGVQLLHAGAVGTPQGGVLLAGRSGAGKSTTALACVVAGLSYAGDDYCAIAAHPRPMAHSLYNSAKLNWADLHRFPQLPDVARRAGDEKALVFLQALYRERIVDRLPIKAVLMPSVGRGPDCELEPLHRAEALRPMVSSTIAQVPGSNGAVLTTTAAFMRQLPCYRLRIGSDMQRIAARIDRLVRSGT